MGTLFYTLIGAGVIVVVCMLLLNFEVSLLGFVAFLGILFAAWFISSILGFIIGEYGPKNRHHNSALSEVTAFTLIFLAPVYYSLADVPSFLHPLAYCFYTTHLARVGKSVIVETSPPFFSIFVIICFLMGGIFVLKKFRWKGYE